MMKKNYGSEQNIYRLFACGPSMAPAAVAAGALEKTCEFGFAHYAIPKTEHVRSGAITAMFSAPEE